MTKKMAESMRAGARESARREYDLALRAIYKENKRAIEEAFTKYQQLLAYLEPSFPKKRA